ncbi:MAG TPA: hypothetical protein VHJ83_12280 [Micromonosporaceae bacterium]|jgi:hypothetical protein|nr:hypothetical protein [Micromonosporaceae bacterium]
MGTTYRVPPTVDTPAEPAGSGTDWVSRDQYAAPIYPDLPARGRHPVPPGEHFIDADERLTFGEEERGGELYPQRRARVSLAAELGLIFGLLGILAALTGVLAPIGFAAGSVGLLFGFAGLATTRRPYVASGPLAVTGLLLSLGALVLAWLAMNGDIDWLSRDDQAGWLRDWLDARFPWLESW